MIQEEKKIREEDISTIYNSTFFLKCDILDDSFFKKVFYE